MPKRFLRKRLKISPPKRFFQRKKSEKKQVRTENIKKRKNLLPTLLITILFWIMISGIIYFIDPHQTGAVLLFFVFILATLFFTFSLILASSRRGVLVASAITAFLILRFFGVGNILNLLLITGLTITVEYYFSKMRD